MIFRLSILGVPLLAFSFANAAPADLIVGDSQWSGSYRYGNNQSVNFSLRLSVSSNGSLSGRTQEPNTFGNKSAASLFANVQGSVQGSGIRFTKTYDGTGGVNHSVSYSGTLGSDGKSMNGTWRIGNDNSGSFSATLVSGGSAGGCIVPGQVRTTESFVYWNFRNNCDSDRQVTVCAERANGVNNILGVAVPARQSADISLGHVSQPTARLSWREGQGIRCP